MRNEVCIILIYMQYNMVTSCVCVHKMHALGCAMSSSESEVLLTPHAHYLRLLLPLTLTATLVLCVCSRNGAYYSITSEGKVSTHTTITD